ncbi:hypothetical protein [Zophobihabitans entericus]|uniref:Uncharacterized protein n=1 Tax=Zophobihabitans entericus TaxID=1635327 RepID=A0A6G9ICC4_9GAMM|nr:hypothetical protein [Zophobihabitans entericus]QIQ21469.1 hypothetical protein IPMB12_07095 [Zophobihabitans entericus]
MEYNNHSFEVISKISIQELAHRSCLISQFYGARGIVAYKVKLTASNTKNDLEQGMNVIANFIETNKDYFKNSSITDMNHLYKMQVTLYELIKGLDITIKTVEDEAMQYHLQALPHIDI